MWQHWALSTDGEVEAGEAEEAELAQQPLVAVSRRGEERTVAGAGAGGGGGGANRGRGGAAAAAAGGRLVARLGRPLPPLQHRVAQQARQRHRQQRQAAPPQPPAKIFSVNEKYFKIHSIIHGHYGDYLLLEISCMIFLSHISWKTYLVSISILCPLKPPAFIHVPAVGQVWPGLASGC